MFFPCRHEGCDKLFNCKKALKEHERTHNQDRPFKCDLCDQTFTQYSSLQKHARVHDKKKPYRCENEGCDQAFSQVSNLIRHQRIHTGEKPYICEICNKQFASGSNLKQHLQIHDKQDDRNQFKCIFQSCDKKYLYPSSLKKHYMVSHREEYEAYLQEQKIETCGFHLKDGEEGDMASHSINDEESEEEQVAAKSNSQIEGRGSTFSSLANAQRKQSELLLANQQSQRNMKKRLYSEAMMMNDNLSQMRAGPGGMFQVQRSSVPQLPTLGEANLNMQQQRLETNDLIERILPRKRPLLMGGMTSGGGSNFSSANSNLGSNSLLISGFGRESHPQHNILNNPDPARMNTLLQRQSSLENLTNAQNSDSFQVNYQQNPAVLSNFHRLLLDNTPQMRSQFLPAIKQQDPLSLQQQQSQGQQQIPAGLSGFPHGNSLNPSTFSLMKTQANSQFKNPESVPSQANAIQPQAQNNMTTMYLNLISSYLSKIQQNQQQVMQIQANKATPESHSVSEFINAAAQQENQQVSQELPGLKDQNQIVEARCLDEERKGSSSKGKRTFPIPSQAPGRIAGLSRQASAALEVASNHSLTSVLSPSVCIRQPFGQAPAKHELLNANHGSLGLISEANHGSAFSALANLGRSYQFRATSIKQPRPKVLVQDGHTLKSSAPHASEAASGLLERAHSSDNISKHQLNEEASRRLSMHILPLQGMEGKESSLEKARGIQQRSRSQEEEGVSRDTSVHQETPQEEGDSEETKQRMVVEESILKSNLTHEIEDINKVPQNVLSVNQKTNNTPQSSVVNTSASSQATLQQPISLGSAFSVVRHLFPQNVEIHSSPAQQKLITTIQQHPHRQSSLTSNTSKKSQFYQQPNSFEGESADQNEKVKTTNEIDNK